MIRYHTMAVVKSSNSYFKRFCQTNFDQGQFDLPEPQGGIFAELRQAAGNAISLLKPLKFN